MQDHKRNIKITITQKKRECIRMEWNETLQAIIDCVENYLQCTEKLEWYIWYIATMQEKRNGEYGNI